MRRILLGLGLLLAVVVGIVLVRTWTFAAPAYTLPDPTPLPAQARLQFNLERVAARVGEAIAMPTVSVQAEPGAAFDSAPWQELHQWLERTYPLIHATLRREKLADWTLVYLWAGADPTLPPIVLMAHQDVVPVTPGTEQEWRHPPFAGTVAEGAVWGRGAVDDKGSLVALFEVVEALLRRGYAPQRTVLLISGHDEELGGTGAQAAARWMAERQLRALFVLDEGMVTVTDFPLLGAPVALIGVAEKGYGTLRMQARSEGGHSSMPPPQTAVDTLALGLVALAAHPDPYRLEGPAWETLRAVAPQAGFGTRMAIANPWLFAPLLKSQISRTPSGAALLHTTQAPTMLRGSPKENVLAAEAEALINYRITPGQTPDSVLAHARSVLADLPLTLAWSGSPKPPSPVAPTDSSSFRWIARMAGGNGELPVAPALVLAATDSYHLSHVAEAVYRHQPLQLSLTELAMIHGSNEHLTLPNLERLLHFYGGLIVLATDRSAVP